MPRVDFDAMVLRTTDLFWCLAISDVEDCFEDRRDLLDELSVGEEDGSGVCAAGQKTALAHLRVCAKRPQ